MFNFSWPVSGSFDFGEWLIGSCQHILVQEYVRLLSPWCEWNKCSRQFILAVSHLDNGSPDKAFDLFMQSANGVLSEFLIEKIIQIGDGISHKEAMSQYFLKIIQLFEQYSALDYVIDLAQAAIDGLDKEDPQLVRKIFLAPEPASNDLSCRQCFNQLSLLTIWRWITTRKLIIR